MAKVGFSHTLEHYTAMRMNELLLNPATLIILTNLILSKRSRTQKNIYYVTPLIKCSQRGKNGSLLEVRSGVPLGLGGRVGAHSDWEAAQGASGVLAMF